MKHLLLSRTLAATAAAALLLVGCSSDNGIEPQSAPVSLDAALSEMSLPALSNAAASAGLTPTVALTSASGCNYDASSASFTCPTVTLSGLTLTRGFTLLDGTGNSQSAYDRTTTAAIRVTTSAVGTVAVGTDMMQLDEHQTTTLSGLLSGVHALDGTVSATMTSTGASAPAETMALTMTMTSVVLPPAGSGGYPRSGTLSMNAHDTVAGLPAANLHMVITFNGTATVPVTIGLDGLPDQHCTIDLAGTSGLSCS